MSEKNFRLILFIALLCVAPTIVFMIQVVVTVPPVVILSAVVVLFVEFFKQSADVPMLLVAFLVATFLISYSIFWLIAFIFSKIASWLPSTWLRYAWLATLLLVLWRVSQQPYYGAGGHGPGSFGPIQDIWKHGLGFAPDTSWNYYFISVGVMVGCAILWRGITYLVARKKSRKKSKTA